MSKLNNLDIVNRDNLLFTKIKIGSDFIIDYQNKRFTKSINSLLRGMNNMIEKPK